MYTKYFKKKRGGGGGDGIELKVDNIIAVKNIYMCAVDLCAADDIISPRGSCNR